MIHVQHLRELLKSVTLSGSFRWPAVDRHDSGLKVY